MRRRVLLGVLALAVGLWPDTASAQAGANPHLVTYRGERGPGLGKHIVFIGGDHEYRSEAVSYTHLTLPTNREV